MEKFKIGMLVRSKAGHDKGQVYVIIHMDERYVYLADGKIRTLERLKKKKLKHVQIILEEHDLTDVDDVKIKRMIREWKKVED